MLATMIVKWTLQLLLLVVILGNIQEIYAQECYVRNEVAAGRPCERPCRSDGTCRKQNRECECDGRCGASCLKKRCPSIPPILNGSSSVDPMTRTIDAIATYTCNHGYSLVGNATRTCLSHKQWSGNPPVCERSTEVHCGILNTPANGQVTYDSETRTVGTVATYQCNAGYTNVAGDQERTCEQNGLWSGLPVSCSQDEACLRNEEEIARQNRGCMKTCTSHNDCLRNRPCVCDGACGLSCIPTDRENYCPALPIRGHNFTLTILPESRNFGSIATYWCKRNYERVRGDAVRTCLGNGDWSGSPTLCLPKDRCGPPPEVSNARPSDNREFYEGNDFVSYSCDPGYYRVGGIRPVLNCHRGNWTHPDFTCRRKSCGDPGFLLNGRRIGTSFLYLDSVRFECDLGYRLVGRDVTHCQTDQDWSHPPPTCQVVRCPSVQNPLHGQKIGYNYSYDSEVAFRCNLGYILEGANEIRCLTTGSWSAAPPTCRATCVVPTRPYYGRWLNNVRDGATKSDGYGLTYTCNSGYFKCQISQLTCIDGEWMPPPESLCLLGCLIQVTQDAGISVNYSHPDGISCTNSRYKPVRTIRSFTCRRGYRIPDGAPGQSTCQSNGRRGQSWSSPMPTCEKILCPPIAIQNGRVRYTLDARLILTLEQNTTATFTCNNGYYKSHHKSSSCDLGIWTNEPPRCIEEPCSESSIDFGYWEAVYNTPESEPGSGYRLGGTIATFNCLQYGYATDVQQTCRLGSWDGQRPFCRKIPCEGENLNNGRVVYSSDRVEHGTDRSYICDDGFTLRGNGASTCDAGQWTRELPECIEDPCSENELDGNGWDLRYRPHAQDRYFKSPGTIATLECPHGYENSGQKICQRGSWRGNRLSCNKIACPEEELQHGRVDYRPSRPEHGSVRIFTCEEGYHQRQPVAESRCNAGVWSTNVPACIEDPCSESAIGVGQWRVVYNRDSVERGTRPHGTTATFVCSERGHRTSDTKQCLTGQWRGDAPTCTKIPCVHQNIRNGRVHYSTDNPEQGTTRNVACKAGYRATEMEDSVCDFGSWTTALPECVEKSCNKMDLQSSEWNIDVSIEEGNNADIIHLPGTVAIVTCNEFGFLDTPTRGGRKTCSFGEWQGFELLCERVSCSREEFSNVRFVYYDHNNQHTTHPQHGGRLQALCESGTHFIDGVVLHTSRCWNGQWEQEVPACIGDPCSENAIGVGQWRVVYNRDSVERGTRPHGTTTTFVCTERGYRTSDTKQCLNGQWRGDAPTCTKIPCVHQNIRNGRVLYSTDNPEQGTTRNVACNVGYRATEMEASVCDLGSWTTALPECVKISCSREEFSNVRFVYYDQNNQRTTHPQHGGILQAVCASGTHFIDGVVVHTSRCWNGQWEQEVPSCVGDPCPPLVNHPDNLAVTYSEESVGSHYPHSTLATFHCVEEGFVLENVNEEQRTCIKGQWRGPNTYPRCAIAICEVRLVDNGNVHYINDTAISRPPRHGDRVTVTCNDGFTISDVIESITCVNGVWDRILPTCAEAKCLAVSSVDYFTIFYNGASSRENEFDAGTELEVSCRDGLIPDRTESSICRNGQWSPSIPRCSSVANCRPVLDEEGREIIYFGDRSYVHGSNLTVSCDNDDNTVLIGSMTSKCNNGTWNPPVGKCLVNVAKNKRAYQGSSTYRDSGADLAVNGLTVENGRCSQTHTTNQWWFVDLGANFAVREIQIYHHDDQNTLLNAEVRVGQEAGSETNQNSPVGRVTDVSSNPVRITVNGNVEGRFVSVDHTGSSDPLVLCEVQIFGDLLGDPCDNGCVVPRSLANGRYGIYLRSGINYRTIDPGSCFRDIHLSVLCNTGNSLFGSHYYTCDQNTGKFDYRNTGHREMLSYCGSSCPRPQINPNVLYFVGENNDPIGDRTAFNQAEEIYSKCEDPRYQLHVGHNRRRCQRGTWTHGVWTGSAPRCDISQLHMDISPTTSLTISPSGQFVLVTPIDEVTISCRNRLNSAQLSGDTRIRKDGEDTQGERSDDTSVFRLVIINPTAEDNGIYTCLSSGLSHSISVTFEVTPVCSRPAINTHVIALGENNLPIANHVSFSEGERLTFWCEDDMTLVGANSIECIEGQWTGRTPTCENNRCSRPHILSNIIAHIGVGEDTTAIGNGESFIGGETITFRCEDVRYQILDGPIHRQCIDGEWTERAPRCETSQLQVGVDNTILKTVSPDGTFIVYPIVGLVFINCQLRTGGRIANSATITTNSTTQPSQRAYSTGKLKRLRLRNPTSGNDGTYTCEAGSQRHSIRIKFQDIRCPAPGNVSNGRWAYVRATENRLDPRAYILNEKVTLQCNPGYHASSNQESRCNYQGQWSPPLSSCTAD
ncbi:sushi, von Willebrand factor type A, EGF and pentraxin domain-containing protein 1-like isoform X3 [Apostichopus japonicus]|uniref:sushi, von Willebrand factor type A, EGF and pentraxin domain-containing protein 1-like isoform X3 n=1 Tax=Stichopus japonicus TaxID=307972 RepID=UPI003AB718B1